MVLRGFTLTEFFNFFESELLKMKRILTLASFALSEHVDGMAGIISEHQSRVSTKTIFFSLPSPTIIIKTGPYIGYTSRGQFFEKSVPYIGSFSKV